MKEQLASLLRHAFTALAGLGGFLFSKGLIDQGDVSAVNGAGVSLGNALVVILAAVLGRVLLTLTAKYFRHGAGELESKDGTSGGNVPAILLLCMGLGLIGVCQVSCTAAQLAAVRAVPIKACVITDQGTVCYSPEDGLSAEVDARSGK